MQRPKERQRQGPPPGSDRGDSSKAEKMKKKFNQHLVQRLESKLEETAYCREGYFTLEKNLNRGKASVRGECREAATDEDVGRFR